MESIILYHLVLIFAGITYSLSNYKQINDALLKKIIFLVPLCIIIIFNGVRYNVGTDYLSYKDIFDGYTIISIEPIFGELMNLFRGFDFSFNLFIFFITSITYFFFFKSFKEEKISTIALIIFLFLNMCYYNNILRQALAVSIFIFSTRFILKNKCFLFIIFIIVATGVHYSAIFLFPIYFVRNVRIKFSFMIYIVGILLFISLLPGLFYKLFVNPILSIPFYGDYFISENGESNLNSGYGVIAKLLLGVVVLYLSSKYLDKRFSLFENLLFIGLLFTILGSQVIIFSRLTNYFYIGIVFLISNIFKQNIKYKHIYLFTIFLISLLFFEAELFLNGNKAVPYHTIFNSGNSF